MTETTLAFAEACANAVEHPRQATRQRIAIEAHRRGSELEIHVRDFGCWSLHAYSEQRGRGLSLIRDLMDSVDLHRTPRGTEIVMRRTVSSA